ncbi:NAD(P)H-hydrate epimerase [Lachnospiraceae bacterium KHCPX20]|nr:NAD(P)H-hydrate epimerase [Lachnospiraceae bacterium KHCPX20]
MLAILDAQEMQKADQYTQDTLKVSGLVLMEKAALALLSYIRETYEGAGRIGILCGSGNNGGDGLALARLLTDEKIDVTVFLVGNPSHFSASARIQYEAAVAYQIPFAKTIQELETCDVFVDAMLGTGADRPLTGQYLEAVRWLNASGRPVVAVDLPTGISASSGQVLGEAVLCSDTVTFGFYKIGQILYPGRSYCGKLQRRRIGITARSLEDKPKVFCMEEHDVKKLLPSRFSDSHKGDYGKLLAVCSDVGMAGAGILGAKASLAMGVGMVKVMTEEANRIILQTSVPEALYTPFDEKELTEDTWASAIMIGPGLGQKRGAKELVRCALSDPKRPLLLDADAINLIALDEELMQLLDRMAKKKEIVLTPHLMEMSRISGCDIHTLKENGIEKARTFAMQHHVTLVLKGACTICALASGEIYLNTTGNSGMATAGSGDVLSGMISALMASGLSGGIAAPLGVYLHGLCGDYARDVYSSRSMKASHLIEMLPRVLLLLG